VASALLILVLFLTLSPQPPSEGSISGGCFWCGSFALADAILNLLLFLPIGFLLALRHGASPVRTWAGLTALAVAIEVAQLFLPGRFATLSDVLMNSAGAAAGIGLARLWRRGLALRGPESGGLTIVAGAAAACVTLGSTVLLSASLPESMWFGQWTPDLGNYEQYRGEVLEARVGELPTPGRRLDDSPAVRERLRNGDPLVIAEHRTGTRVQHLRWDGEGDPGARRPPSRPRVPNPTTSFRLASSIPGVTLSRRRPSER
jgi:hypothetical protein